MNSKKATLNAMPQSKIGASWETKSTHIQSKVNEILIDCTSQIVCLFKKCASYKKKGTEWSILTSWWIISVEPHADDFVKKMAVAISAFVYIWFDAYFT